DFIGCPHSSGAPALGSCQSSVVLPFGCIRLSLVCLTAPWPIVSPLPKGRRSRPLQSFTLIARLTELEEIPDGVGVVHSHVQVGARHRHAAVASRGPDFGQRAAAR